jgi:hypothetical protein
MSRRRKRNEGRRGGGYSWPLTDICQTAQCVQLVLHSSIRLRDTMHYSTHERRTIWQFLYVITLGSHARYTYTSTCCKLARFHRTSYGVFPGGGWHAVLPSSVQNCNCSLLRNIVNITPTCSVPDTSFCFWRFWHNLITVTTHLALTRPANNFGSQHNSPS